MRTSHHFWFLLLVVMLLVPVPLLLLWHNLPTSNIIELWADSANRLSFLINIISSIAYAVGIGLLVLLRRTILHWIKVFLLGGYSVEEQRRVEQERLYLENLIERFHRELPWEVNKYTDLEAIQEDLEKQARQVRPRIWGLSDTSEARVEANSGSRVNVRQFLRKTKGPIMLKGNPGTGKTLTVRRFAVNLAQEALREKRSIKVKIPIYIFLGSYTGKTAENEPEPVFDFLQHYLQDEFPATAFLREHLTEYLLEGRLILLFDGLNEMPPDEYMPRYQKLEGFVLRKYPKNKAIFTCRILRHTSLANFNTVVISELSDNQIKRFITVYRGEEAAETFYRDLTSGDGFMLRVCRNSFMLQMLVRRDPTRPLPHSPAQLFEEYVYDQLNRVTKDFRQAIQVENVIEILQDISFYMQNNGKFSGIITYESIKSKMGNPALAEFLAIAQQAQLIDYTSDKSVQFYHQILQEYFAAIALRRDWQEGKSLETYFKDYRWEETILVCAGIIQNPESFIRAIWSSDESSKEAFWLATKAAGSSGMRVSHEYSNRLIEEGKKNLELGEKSTTPKDFSKIVLIVDTVKALSYIDNDYTAELLDKALRKHDGWIRELCIQVLGNSRNPSARRRLRPALFDVGSLSNLFLAKQYFTNSEWFVLVAQLLLAWLRVLLILLFFISICIIIPVIFKVVIVNNNFTLNVYNFSYSCYITAPIFILSIGFLYGIVRFIIEKSIIKAVLYLFSIIFLLLLLVIMVIITLYMITVAELIFYFIPMYIVYKIIYKARNIPQLALFVDNLGSRIIGIIVNPGRAPRSGG